MKVLVTGARGLVGRALVRSVPPDVVLSSCTREELDISDEYAVADYTRLHRPDVIVNAAGFLAADRAESEVMLARAVNSDGPKYLAVASRALNSRLVQISTSYVFDGLASRPYRPDACTNPLSVYGATKRDGENAVLEILPERSVVLRASWLYATEGNSFLGNMLRSMIADKSVRAVTDQIGTPTSADFLAQVVWKIIIDMPDLNGVHHCSDVGVASWYDCAVAVAEEGATAGLVAPDVVVIPSTLEDSPRGARRPRYSVLDTTSLTAFGITSVHWRKRLRSVLKKVRESRPESASVF